MRENKLKKSHVLRDLIVNNLFVKKKIYQSVCFTKMWWFYLKGVWLWRIKWGSLTGECWGSDASM